MLRTRRVAQLEERLAAVLPWLMLHGLRHGFGPLLAVKGVYTRVSMELMGHPDIRLTMEISTHVAPELAREVADKLDAVGGDGTA